MSKKITLKTLMTTTNTLKTLMTTTNTLTLESQIFKQMVLNMLLIMLMQVITCQASCLKLKGTATQHGDHAVKDADHHGSTEMPDIDQDDIPRSEMLSMPKNDRLSIANSDVLNQDFTTKQTDMKKIGLEFNFIKSNPAPWIGEESPSFLAIKKDLEKAPLLEDEVRALESFSPNNLTWSASFSTASLFRLDRTSEICYNTRVGCGRESPRFPFFVTIEEFRITGEVFNIWYIYCKIFDSHGG